MGYVVNPQNGCTLGKHQPYGKGSKEEGNVDLGHPVMENICGSLMGVWTLEAKNMSVVSIGLEGRNPADHGHHWRVEPRSPRNQVNRLVGEGIRKPKATVVMGLTEAHPMNGLTSKG